MEDYEYISDYFNRSLSAEEMKQFDQKIQEDPVFAEEVAFYCSSLSVIKDELSEEKKKRFREIYNAEEAPKQNKTPVIFMRRWLKLAAAAAVVIIVIAGWFWWSQPTAMELADKYINENFSELPVTMGNGDSLQKGKDLYNDKKFAEALEQFETILRADTGNMEAKKYAGIISLKLRQYDKALEYFIRMENNTKLEVNPGKFYHALVLLERNQDNDKEEAGRLLRIVVTDNLEGIETAKELIKHL